MLFPVFPRPKILRKGAPVKAVQQLYKDKELMHELKWEAQWKHSGLTKKNPPQFYVVHKKSTHH